jgi:hypothetical protein
MVAAHLCSATMFCFYRVNARHAQLLGHLVIQVDFMGVLEHQQELTNAFSYVWLYSSAYA